MGDWEGPQFFVCAAVNVGGSETVTAAGGGTAAGTAAGNGAEAL
jgi:hypothetical protein